MRLKINYTFKIKFVTSYEKGVIYKEYKFAGKQYTEMGINTDIGGAG
jgi:hypothetical protein